MQSKAPAPFRPEPAAVTLADLGGVRLAGVAAGIKPSGKPDVALLVADADVSCAGVFTRNAFAAAPVKLCRAHLHESGGRIRAVVINAGNANACTGERGERDAQRMAERVASLVGCAKEQVLVASTGVIGVPLPFDRVEHGIDLAFAELAREPAAARRFLDAIQTTDAYPKEAGERGEGAFNVAGVAKGAGMIEPNMATMIALAGCDLAIEPGDLAQAATTVAARTFNAVHVDSHTSTNDTLLLFATGTNKAAVSPSSWAAAFERVSHRLAWLIARDGEGATKVTTVDVVRAPSEAVARDIARRIAHSALVRTALYGNDPNWGRFVSAAGNSELEVDFSRLVCRLQGTVVFERGEPTAFDRAAASHAMVTDDVSLEIDLGAGNASARVLTSDLGYRYVEINAEYTT
jgi:glutamate N-acetyltransferase/amino-acid N-acetyltransferase